MTGNRYILNENAEVEDTSTCMTFDSFTEILTVLNGQDARIKYLERKLERERCATQKQHLKWSEQAEERIKELEKAIKTYDNGCKEIYNDKCKLEKENKQLKQEVNELYLYKGSEEYYKQLFNDKCNENERMKTAFKRKYDYDLEDVVEEVFDGER